MLTQEEAKELVCRSPFQRRSPSQAWLASRAAARAARCIEGRKPPYAGPDPDWVGMWEEGWLPIAGGASYANLILDTTAPAGVTLALNGNATYATAQLITAAINTSDTPTTGYQIAVWGDVDITYNTSIQTAAPPAGNGAPGAGQSAWITPGAFPANQAVKLAAGDGLKTINIRVRDDVWNESATVTKTITLDTTVPTVNITAGPDVTKVSTVAGKRTMNMSFTVGAEPITAWEVAVVSSGASARGSGTVVGVANGSTGVTGAALAGGAIQAVSIDGRDLQAASAGDGTKVLKVFVQDAAGNWSV